MIQVYKSGSIGEPFTAARTSMVATVEAFRDELERLSITPNITAAIDNHQTMGPAFPFATVGVSDVNFEYQSKTGSAFEVLAQITVDVQLHIAQRDGQYDERIKWALMQSLVNYMKNVSTTHTDIDALWIRSVSGDRTFALGTVGGSLTVELWKVMSG